MEKYIRLRDVIDSEEPCNVIGCEQCPFADKDRYYQCMWLDFVNNLPHYKGTVVEVKERQRGEE